MAVIFGGVGGIDTSPASIGATVTDLNQSFVISPSNSTTFTLFSSLSQITAQFTGTGFGSPDVNGVPTTGTATGFTQSIGGQLAFSVSNLSVSVLTLRTLIFNSDATTLTTVLFGANDTFDGSDSPDALYSYAGNDAILGNGGSDLINGGTGDDAMAGGPGNDILIGDAGFDLASYFNAPGSVVVSLALTGSQNTGSAGFDQLSSIEDLEGSAFADTLIGNSLGNFLYGLAGNDVLNGGVGADLLSGGDGTDTASYANATSGLYLFIGDGGSWSGEAQGDQLISIENITGSAFNDILGWDDGANVLDGGGGNDLLVGQGGADTLIGGAGIDMASYATAPSGVYVFFGDGGNFTGDAQGDTFSSIEQLTGSSFNDVLGMDDGANKLVGNAGNDILFGEGGGDELFGNDGFDTVSYANAPGGIYVFYADLGNATGDAAGDSFFSSIESVIGSAFNDIIGAGAFNDTLIGGAGDDVLYGQGGGDTFFGNAGFDTVSYALAPAGVYVFYADLGNATGDAAGDREFSAIESVVGSAFNDIIGAGGFADTLIGGGGDDVLYGQGGADTLTGGAGADRFAYLSTGWGADAISDWQDGVDRIDFSRVAGLTFAALTLTQESGGVRVTLGGDSIFIGGANLASTTAADFIFGP